MKDRKPIILYLPEDAEIVSVMVARQIPMSSNDGNTYYQNAIVASCFQAAADAHDALTGNSFGYDMEENKWVVLNSEEENPLMPDDNEDEIIENNEELNEEDIEVLEEIAKDSEEMPEENLQNE